MFLRNLCVVLWRRGLRLISASWDLCPRENEVWCFTIQRFQVRRREIKIMASGHFDELTRNLATSTSRRQAFKAIFVGALGGALGLGSLGPALAMSCKSVNAKCTHNNECCSQDCYSSPHQIFGEGNCWCSKSGYSCNSNNDCCSGLHCSSGKCKK